MLQENLPRVVYAPEWLTQNKSIHIKTGFAFVMRSSVVWSTQPSTFINISKNNLVDLKHPENLSVIVIFYRVVIFDGGNERLRETIVISVQISSFAGAFERLRMDASGEHAFPFCFFGHHLDGGVFGKAW